MFHDWLAQYWNGFNVIYYNPIFQAVSPYLICIMGMVVTTLFFKIMFPNLFKGKE